MRLLANENIPGDCIAALRRGGADVIWIRESSPGALDADVLRRATDEQRVLVTFDKDFGELAFQAKLPAQCGIILLRFPMPKSDDAGARIASLILSRADWNGNFSVIEPGRVRIRALS